MIKIEKIDDYYKCDKNCTDYKLIIIHEYPVVNTLIDELEYYLTIEGDRVFHEDLIVKKTKMTKLKNSNIYKPVLESTTYIDNCYKTIYAIHCPINNTLDNDVHIHFNLPFDYKRNIKSLELFSLIN